MTVLDSENATLEACLTAIHDGPVVLRKKGQSIALVQRFAEQTIRQSLHPVFVDFEDTSLAACLKSSKRGYVAIKQGGKFVATLQPFDQEQFELSTSDKFWQMMERARRSPRISLEELERRLGLEPYKPKTKRKSSVKPKAKKAVVK